MKKSNLYKCILAFYLTAFVVFPISLIAQNDVLDLCPMAEGKNDCSTSPVITIPVNYDATGMDTLVIIDNLSGKRLLNPTVPDKQYKFCAANNNMCSTLATDDGEFHIRFMCNSLKIAVDKLSFNILNYSGGTVTVTAYQGATGTIITGTNITDGKKYICDDFTAFDSIKVVSAYDAVISNQAELFVLDSLFILYNQVNQVPSDISLSSSSVNENESISTTVGSLSTTDADVGDSHTYSFVSGTGDSDNSSFSISGNNLQTAAVFDYETKSSYSVRIQTDDGNGGTYAKAFAISITDLPENNAPTDISLSSNSINENESIGTTVGSLSTTDADVGDSHTYSFVSGTGDSDNGSFSISGNNLQSAAVFDFETKSSYSVRIQTDDGNGGTYAKAFAISITDLPENNAPTDISLSSNSINENESIGTTVGSLSTTDADVGDSHTYSFVSGTGDSDNGSFSISGNNLQTAAVFDYETKSSYSVRIQTDDGNGGTYAKAFTISITDVVMEGTPQVVCLFDLSYSMNRDFNDTYTSNPNAVKLKQATSAFVAFADLLFSFNPGEATLGMVRFPNSPQVGCDAGTIKPIQTLDASYNSELASDIPLLIADGGSTPILAGIDFTVPMFNTDNQKVVVLLTDGRQNCPSAQVNSTSLTSYTDLLNNNTIKLYTIGFGAITLVPNDFLNTLAGGTGGLHFNIDAVSGKEPYNPGAPDTWNSATALHATFANIIIDGLGLESSTDPLDIIEKGSIKNIEIPVTQFDNKVCFFVSWVSSKENNLGVKLFTPNGSELDLEQSGIIVLNRTSHTMITLSNEILKQNGMVGSWMLEIDGSQIENSSEYYQYTVINASKKLTLNTWFDKDKYYTGDKMKIYLELLAEDQRLKPLDSLSIKGTRPGQGLGTWLAGRAVTREQLEIAQKKELDAFIKWKLERPEFKKTTKTEQQKFEEAERLNYMKNIDPVHLKARVLADQLKLTYPQRVKIAGIKFNDEGREGDEIAGDGIYTALFDSLRKEGSYQFYINALDTSKGKDIRRESQLQTYVNVYIELKRFIKKITLVDSLNNKPLYEVVLSLKDKYGNIPSPQALIHVKVALNKGEVIDGIQANADGTFTQRLTLPENTLPKEVSMTLTIDNRSGTQKLEAGKYTSLYIIGIIFLLLLMIVYGRKNKI